MAEAQAPRNSILDATAMSMEGRKRRYGDLGHLLPMSGNSRNVQVRKTEPTVWKCGCLPSSPFFLPCIHCSGLSESAEGTCFTTGLLLMICQTLRRQLGSS